MLLSQHSGGSSGVRSQTHAFGASKLWGTITRWLTFARTTPFLRLPMGHPLIATHQWYDIKIVGGVPLIPQPFGNKIHFPQNRPRKANFRRSLDTSISSTYNHLLLEHRLQPCYIFICNPIVHFTFFPPISKRRLIGLTVSPSILALQTWFARILAETATGIAARNPTPHSMLHQTVKFPEPWFCRDKSLNHSPRLTNRLGLSKKTQLTPTFFTN